jgi:deazaflavin-dependent oxidoreductase (nitroreductase family)
MWFGNIKTNPEVEVEVANDNGTEQFKAHARVVDSGDEHGRLYKEMSRIWPAFIDYQTRTERLIPVVVLERRH